MERTKKMLLVDPEMAQRFQQTAPSHDVKSDTGDEMSRILHSTDMSDGEKRQKLYQVMQRFFHFASEARKPLAVEFRENTADSVENELTADDQKIRTLTLASLPKMSKQKGTLMFDRLLASNSISWDNLGVVSIGDRKIDGSSITDLVSDSVRNRRTGSPIGWREFTDVLGDINMPNELIGNIRRKNFIRNRHLGRNVSLNSSSASNTTPRNQRSLGVPWQNFSF
jgi:hypothetical protein